MIYRDLQFNKPSNKQEVKQTIGAIKIKQSSRQSIDQTAHHALNIFKNIQKKQQNNSTSKKDKETNNTNKTKKQKKTVKINHATKNTILTLISSFSIFWVKQFCPHLELSKVIFGDPLEAGENPTVFQAAPNSHKTTTFDPTKNSCGWLSFVVFSEEIFALRKSSTVGFGEMTLFLCFRGEFWFLVLEKSVKNCPKNRWKHLKSHGCLLHFPNYKKAPKI